MLGGGDQQSASSPPIMTKTTMSANNEHATPATLNLKLFPGFKMDFQKSRVNQVRTPCCIAIGSIMAHPIHLKGIEMNGTKKMDPLDP
jgi:hypothetical protein